MRTLLKIGAFMVALAVVLTGVSYNVLQAQEVKHPSDPAARRVSTEVRNISSEVTIIKLSGPVDLVLKQGAAPTMTVQAEQRVISRIKTVQSGDTLNIEAKGMFLNVNHPMRVELILPALKQLVVLGSGDGEVKGFSGDRIQLALRGSGNVVFNGQYKHVDADVLGSGDLELNAGTNDDVALSVLGSGNVTATGQCKALTAKITGSGDIDAMKLTADTATVSVLGSGNASIFAKQSTNLSLIGSGDIHVEGKPTQRVINRTGSGDVSWD